MELIRLINIYVTGPVLPALLLLTAMIMTPVTLPYWLKYPRRTLQGIKSGGASSAMSLALALAGTLGVGNITGVAAAVTVGGAGAVFWMWVSAGAAAILKYCEVALAVRYSTPDSHGGAAVYMKNGVKNKVAAATFSIICVGASFTVGNGVQVRAAADCSHAVFGIPNYITGIVMAAAVLGICSGGSGKIKKFTAVIIPLLTVMFAVMSVAVIALNFERIPGMIEEIFNSAFNIGSVGGGITGFLLSRAVRLGVSRGIMSNEAGCGTAPCAYCSDNGKNAVEQGVWGIIEVIIDTVLLCTMTAFVILLALPEGARIPGVNATEAVIAAFETVFGRGAGVLITVSVFFFALASAVCWSFYGEESILSLGGGKKSVVIYRVLFGLACIPFAVTGEKAVWELADLSVAFMAIINCAALVCLSGELKKVVKNYYRPRYQPSEHQTDSLSESA